MLHAGATSGTAELSDAERKRMLQSAGDADAEGKKQLPYAHEKRLADWDDLRTDAAVERIISA